jgi:hypothetical protein
MIGNRRPGGVREEVIPLIHTANKEKEKGAKRKRNDYYPLTMGGPFPAIEVGHTGLSKTTYTQRSI